MITMLGEAGVEVAEGVTRGVGENRANFMADLGDEWIVLMGQKLEQKPPCFSDESEFVN